MSVLSIPVQIGNPVHGFSSQFTTTVLLEERRYAFSFYTNKPQDSWFFDILDPVTLEPAIAGLGLAVGLDLLYPYRYLGIEIIPPGILYVNDTVGSGKDPSLTSFQDEDAILYYCTSDECSPFLG